MPSIVTVVSGWIVVIGIVATLWYFDSKHKARRPLLSKPSYKNLTSQKNVKSRRLPLQGGHSSGDQEVKIPEKAQRKRVQNSKIDRDTTLPCSLKTNYDDQDHELDNKEFARRLASTKAGTLLPSRRGDGPPKKSVKQSHAEEKSFTIETSSDNNTARSSITGGDADDDKSSLNSPDLKATITNGEISDMLEPPTPGPSVLRVTATTHPIPSKKPNPPQSFAPNETKKQRQNKNKAEALKFMRREDEDERKRRLEKHRRNVRETEGRPARDGSTFMAAEASVPSAWAKSLSKTNEVRTEDTKKLVLLDTFEPSNIEANPSNPVDDTYSPSEMMGSEWAQLPSEEEQMQHSLEESKNWEVVGGKDKRNKKHMKDGHEEMNDGNGQNQAKSISCSRVHNPYAYLDLEVPPISTPQGPGAKWDLLLTYDVNGEHQQKMQSVQDSEWEVA